LVLPELILFFSLEETSRVGLKLDNFTFILFGRLQKLVKFLFLNACFFDAWLISKVLCIWIMRLIIAAV